LDENHSVLDEKHSVLDEKHSIVDEKHSPPFDGRHSMIMTTFKVFPVILFSGEGGASFSGSVQTSHVSAPVGKTLLLESTTRNLEVSAPQGVSIESRAGDISAHCLKDLTLQSTGGMVSE